jgi:nucleoside-diphosphate-sugar epimerase
MAGCVLVTGASGFIGSALVPALAMAGWRVRAASRNPKPVAAGSAIEPVVLPDLADSFDWAPLLQDVTHVVHLAGIAHASPSTAEDRFMKINGESVGALAEAAGERRLIFLSSVRVLAGASADHTLQETDGPAPSDAFTRSKLAAERRLAESGTDWTVLRAAAVYGKGVKANLGALMMAARTSMPLPFGALDNRRSLLALDNLISAIRFVLGSDAASRESFLVADPEPIAMAEFVERMRESLGKSGNLVRIPERAIKRVLASFGREDDFERLSGNLVVDIGKLRGIGWTPPLTTAEGIRRMMRD